MLQRTETRTAPPDQPELQPASPEVSQPLLKHSRNAGPTPSKAGQKDIQSRKTRLAGRPGVVTDELLEKLLTVFAVKNENIQWQRPLSGGLTNNNFIFTVDSGIHAGKEYVLRVPGDKTEILTNREQEKKHIDAVSKLNLDVPNIYFDPGTGMKVTEFLQAEPLNKDTVWKNRAAIIVLLQRLHKMPVEETEVFSFAYHGKLDQYEQESGDQLRDNFSGYQDTKHRVLALVREYCSDNTSLCHNDLVPGNILADEHRLYLIDWEYSGLNDPFFDIASLTLESGLTDEQSNGFLGEYLGREPSHNEKYQLKCWQLAQDLLWSAWAACKINTDQSYRHYGQQRFQRVKARLADIPAPAQPARES